MTNKDAIKVLEMVDAYGIADEAKRVAIEALERVPDIEWIEMRLEYKSSKGHTIMYGYGCSHCGCFVLAKSQFCKDCGGRYEGKIMKEKSRDFEFGGF